MAYMLNVNGQDYDVEIKSNETWADVLRDKLGLIGVKVSCGEGECGSCTILVDGIPCTACLMLGCQGEGHELTTVEGIGDYNNLHPIQQAFIDEQGFQCGFCTPGMVMSSVDLLKKNKNPSEQEIRDWLEGNICRCTGYQGIVAAVKDAASKM